jgi:hypothetical protein
MSANPPDPGPSLGHTRIGQTELPSQDPRAWLALMRNQTSVVSLKFQIYCSSVRHSLTALDSGKAAATETRALCKGT